jgi:hypothetical protein
MADRKAAMANVGKLVWTDSAEILPYAQNRSTPEEGINWRATDEIVQDLPENKLQGEKTAENLRRNNDEILNGAGKA